MNTFTIPDNIINSMESSQRDFWWGKSIPREGYLRSWPRICTHKYQGGLGFGNHKYVNLSILTKTAWNVIHKPDLLCVIILKRKYFKSFHPLHRPKKDDVSWVWRSISRGIEVIRKNSKWKVRNGENIYAFTDNWIPSFCEPKCISNPNLNFLVSAFIDEDTKSWKPDLVNAYFTQQNARNIIGTRIPLSGNDMLVWPHTKNGMFSVKSAYKIISGQHDFLHNSQNSNHVYKSLWNLPILPKVQNFDCKCHENIFPAKSVLHRYSYGHDSSCNMCNSGIIESPEHIILQCEFSKSVWSLTPYAYIIE